MEEKRRSLVLEFACGKETLKVSINKPAGNLTNKTVGQSVNSIVTAKALVKEKGTGANRKEVAITSSSRAYFETVLQSDNIL